MHRTRLGRRCRSGCVHDVGRQRRGGHIPGRSHGQEDRSSRHRAERVARGRRPPLVSGRRCDGDRPCPVYKSALHGKALGPPSGIRCRGRSRPSSRARTRPSRRAAKPVPGDRVLARVGQRPDQLKPHAGADRRRRVRRRRAGARHRHAGRRADRLHQRAGARRARSGAVPLQRRASRPVLEARRGDAGGQTCSTQNGRPRAGHLDRPGRAARVARDPRGHGQGRRLRALARHAQRPRRRGRQHDVGRRQGAARAGRHGHGRAPARWPHRSNPTSRTSGSRP